MVKNFLRHAQIYKIVTPTKILNITLRFLISALLVISTFLPQKNIKTLLIALGLENLSRLGELLKAAPTYFILTQVTFLKIKIFQSSYCQNGAFLATEPFNTSHQSCPASPRLQRMSNVARSAGGGQRKERMGVCCCSVS